MRVLIISDVHANLAALRALPEADAVVCAGDVVGFGPDCGAVIDLLQAGGAACVRGDEDDAIARAAAHPAPLPLAHAADEMRRRTASLLGAKQLRWLKSLPPELEVTFDGVRIGITHAYPGDYTRYIKPTEDEISRIGRAFPHCDVVVVGHTHRQGSWQGRCLIVNPGSVGFPQRAGYASYAMLENGNVTFGQARYDPTETLDALRKLDLSEEAYEECTRELTMGSSRPYDRLAPAR